MKILVINIAEESGRLNFQEAQMDALGLAWERVEAVPPRILSPPVFNPLYEVVLRHSYVRVGAKALCKTILYVHT